MAPLPPKFQLQFSLLVLLCLLISAEVQAGRCEGVSKQTYGDIKDGACYAVDTTSCHIDSEDGVDCSWIYQEWVYYNYESEKGKVVYQTVGVYLDLCTSSCRVDGIDCSCSVDGSKVTLQDCGTNQGGSQGRFETPQTINIPTGEEYFDLENTKAMCNHPAVVAARIDRESGQSGSNLRGVQTRGGRPVDKWGSSLPAKTYGIPTTLTFHFEAGTGADLDLPTRTHMLLAVTEFIQATLDRDAAFHGTIKSLVMDKATVDYNGADSLILSFDALITLFGGATASQRQAVNDLGTAHWTHYINELVYQSKNTLLSQLASGEGNSLAHVKNVKVRAVGKES